MAELEKPFWIRPPYIILFDLLHLHRVRPWDVNITFLLNSFLSEMKKHGYIDFSVSGTALLSSSIIHRLKSELILEMEEPPKPPQVKPTEYMPPPLPMPLRYEYTSTSIAQIMNALEEVLSSKRLEYVEQKSILQAVPVIEQLDEFLTNIEDHLKEFYCLLTDLSKKIESIPFTRLVEGLSISEVVRRFIMLLFLASDGKINLLQEEELGEIVISVL